MERLTLRAVPMAAPEREIMLFSEMVIFSTESLNSLQVLGGLAIPRELKISLL